MRSSKKIRNILGYFHELISFKSHLILNYFRTLCVSSNFVPQRSAAKITPLNSPLVQVRMDIYINYFS